MDWALDGPVLGGAATSRPGTVHVADSVEQMTEALGQVSAGAIPAEPFLLTGQMTTADPTRSPAGTEALWAYTHVPQQSHRDAGEAAGSGTATTASASPTGCRPGSRRARVRERVLARRVLGPREMEARDANLIGGALNAGTSQLHQGADLPPGPGPGRAETPIGGLYLGSASAHPEAGSGAPGMNAARAAILHARLRAVRPGAADNPAAGAPPSARPRRFQRTFSIVGPGDLVTGRVGAVRPGRRWPRNDGVVRSGAAALHADVLVPQRRVLGDEGRHHLDAPGVVEHDHLHPARREQRLAAHEVAVLPTTTRGIP